MLFLIPNRPTKFPDDTAVPAEAEKNTFLYVCLTYPTGLPTEGTYLESRCFVNKNNKPGDYILLLLKAASRKEGKKTHV